MTGAWIICAWMQEVDIGDMDLPEPPLQRSRPSRAPTSGLQMMVAILVALLLLAIFANVQKFRANRIESITITPTSSATPAPNGR
jgi:hypothetical protein